MIFLVTLTTQEFKNLKKIGSIFLKLQSVHSSVEIQRPTLATLVYVH